MVDFTNRVWTSGDAPLPVHLYIPHGASFRHAVMEKDKVYYLTALNDECCIMVLAGGDEVRVALPLEKVREMLASPDINADKIDFLPYTGQSAIRHAVSSIFNQVTSAGQRAPDQDAFDIIFFSTAGTRITVSSDKIGFLQESCHDQVNAVYVSSNLIKTDGDRYCPLPVDVMQQFMTHAMKSGARTLDLTAVTEPGSVYQQNRDMIAAIDRPYPAGLFPYKKYGS